jgi:hypothetical protein
MNVVNDDHGRSSPPVKKMGQSPEEIALIFGVQGSQDLWIVVGHVPERFQRPRRQEVVACSRQGVDLPLMMGGELGEQTRLADAGFSADEHNLARPVRGLEHSLSEQGKFLVPL